MSTLIQAHRGAPSRLPENTLESFSLAIEQKADFIELDVHLSKDGEIVVAHDAKLERVSNGCGFINDLTLKELKLLDFGKTAPEGEAGSRVYRMPLLSEVFALVKASALSVNIELKCIERLYPELPEKLLALTSEYAMDDRVIYSSFNHYSLQQIKKLSASAKTGLLYELGMVDPWVYANYVNAYAIHPHYYVIAALPETVKHCHENGVMVNVWTVDDADAIKLMLKCGVDSIITNKPDLAVACRDEFLKGETNEGK